MGNCIPWGLIPFNLLFVCFLYTENLLFGGYCLTLVVLPCRTVSDFPQHRICWVNLETLAGGSDQICVVVFFLACNFGCFHLWLLNLQAFVHKWRGKLSAHAGDPSHLFAISRTDSRWIIINTSAPLTLTTGARTFSGCICSRKITYLHSKSVYIYHRHSTS